MVAIPLTTNNYLYLYVLLIVDIFTSEIIEGLTSDVQGEVPYYADLLTNEAVDKQMKVADIDESAEVKQNGGEENKTENSEEETGDKGMNGNKLFRFVFLDM